MSKITSPMRRRRKPGELPTLRIAVRNHCLECVGYQGPEVAKCTAPKCWLYPYRMSCSPGSVRGRRLQESGVVLCESHVDGVREA